MLRETGAVSLARSDHPHRARLTDTEEHAAERFQINIVERGCFQLGYGRAEYTLVPGSIFLSRPGETYRYAHFRDVEPDVCTSIAFTGDLAGEVAGIFPRLRIVLPHTNRLRYLREQLQASTNSEPLSVDSIACELVDAAAHAREGSHLYSPQQLKWYVQRIQAAREEMDANAAGHHSLWRLSSVAAMSPFAFARVFREFVGLPPHRYLLRRRLERARILLQSGMSVTDTCYEVGFHNPAHFTRSYRRHFGHLPSRVRA